MVKNLGASERHTLEKIKQIDKILRQRTGIKLTDTMAQRIKSGLEKISHNESEEEYLIRVLSSEFNSAQAKELIDLITVNETYFFRNESHFKIMEEEVIPRLVEEKIDSPQKMINVWSAGCSTGEEPYSLAMLLKDKLPFGYKFKIYATDINMSVLKKAQAGVYGKNSIRNSLIEEYTQYFNRLDQDKIEIKKEIKNHVIFMYLNLKENIFLFGLDLIFFRNVFIYFDEDMKKEIISKIKKALKPGGYLFLGTGEGSSILKDEELEFKYINGGSYWRKRQKK